MVLGDFEAYINFVSSWSRGDNGLTPEGPCKIFRFIHGEITLCHSKNLSNLIVVCTLLGVGVWIDLNWYHIKEASHD